MENNETPMELTANTAERWFIAVIENNDGIKRHIIELIDAFDKQIYNKGEMRLEENTLISSTLILCREKIAGKDFLSKKLFLWFEKNNEPKALALQHIVTEFILCIEKGIHEMIRHVSQSNDTPTKEAVLADLDLLLSETEDTFHPESADIIAGRLLYRIKNAVREANFIANPLG